MPDPKLAPLSAAAWPDVLADLEDAFAGQLNVYRTMAHHPALVQAWANLRQHVVLDTSLGRDRSEVVILRAAVTLNSEYEWSHHVYRARKLGFSDARIAALRGPTSGMAADDAVIAGAVDEVLAMARLTPGTLAALTELVGSEGVLDLFATVGFYSTLGFIVNTFSTPIDDEIAQSLHTAPLGVPAQ
jgi:alkylhydroperoxidase family enzyme